MNQDAFLDLLWREVINAPLTPADLAAHRALAQRGDADDRFRAARYARYAAVFDLCFAFDEEEIEGAAFLDVEHAETWDDVATQDAGRPWRPAHVREDSAFADAHHAVDRLLECGVTALQLGAFWDAQRVSAVAAVRRLWEAQLFADGALAGVHASLLSADPSGNEGGNGSWPYVDHGPRSAR